ncbi:class I SAM-dependent methyltransferase [Granulicella cerasi]|uniref:Class I SAM-dependent methyltransferase n=1 Tax=Granulicella cerasi TaxID=741063 RepID=A0ABW1ZAK5_9BACT|nr:class I SAM-dependent methyltransferase [Granulicella cerasi]
MEQNRSFDVFEATAANYDRERMKLIPGHQRLYAAALSLIPPAAKTIVDLGAGTGLFSAMVHRALPNAQLHMIDFSPRMLEQARERLGDADNLRYITADYSADPLPSSACAVVSSMSIHHLDDEAKQRLFARIYETLKPHGVFINVDHIAGHTPELEAIYQQRWLTAIRAEGATEQQVSDSLYRQQEDRRVSIATQLQWMRDAGFAHVDCWHKDNSFAVLCGTRL